MKLLARYEALVVALVQRKQTKFEKALLPQGWQSVRQMEAVLMASVTPIRSQSTIWCFRDRGGRDPPFPPTLWCSVFANANQKTRL